MERTIENLLKWRKKDKNRSKSVNFDEAKAIIEGAQEKGVNVINSDIKFVHSGARSRQKGSIQNTIGGLSSFFSPGVLYTTENEFVYEEKFEGKYEVYSGKKSEKHYLDTKCLLYGGRDNCKGEITKKGRFSWEIKRK